MSTRRRHARQSAFPFKLASDSPKQSKSGLFPFIIQLSVQKRKRKKKK
jgi:hypothetical protein